jgi:Ran GTPase-activating protein (RanGAP) involved in mRNA processing and transport
LGWLGYFIGKSVKLQCLDIRYLPEDDGGEQQMHAFSDGIARNQSIQKVVIDKLSSNGFAAIARALGNLSQLEELVLKSYYNAGLNVNGCSALGTLLESGASKLKKLDLVDNDISDAGVAAFAHGLRTIGPSLKVLDLAGNSIRSEGLSALVAGLANCTSLERLDLSYNGGFSSAAAGLRSLSDWLQRAALNLDELRLRDCNINDEGLQAMAGTVNHCKDLDLSSNQSITASGLRYLSASLQSENCCLENLYLGWMDTVNGGAQVLARGLVGNKVLRRLHLRIEGQDDIEIPPAGWDAFSKALCDTSTINKPTSQTTLYKNYITGITMTMTPTMKILILKMNVLSSTSS